MKKKNSGTRRRIETIDIAKAIAIFCVILGHTTGNLDTPLFRRVLYSFHMPLFFFLAGLSVKPAAVRGLKGWGAFLYKNILALMVPYLIWGLVYAPFSYQNMMDLFYGSWEALTRMETLTSLWYLSCFFVSRVIVQIVIDIAEYAKVKNMPLWCGIAALPLLAAGLLFSHSENGALWCSDIQGRLYTGTLRSGKTKRGNAAIVWLYPSHYRANSGLSPVRNVRRRAHHKKRTKILFGIFVLFRILFVSIYDKLLSILPYHYKRSR